MRCTLSRRVNNCGGMGQRLAARFEPCAAAAVQPGQVRGMQASELVGGSAARRHPTAFCSAPFCAAVETAKAAIRLFKEQRLPPTTFIPADVRGWAAGRWAGQWDCKQPPGR